MAESNTFKVQIVWEDELRTAARALKRMMDAQQEPNTEIPAYYITEAIQTCWAALYGLWDDDGVVLMGNKAPFAATKKGKKNA